MNTKPIDIVVLYVDENDKNWQAEFAKYKNIEIAAGIQKPNGEQSFQACRSRTWNNFRYFFRGVEKNCPWVNNIFLIVQSKSQLPDWLDTSNKRLKIVYHEDFIPQEFLPTFNNFVMETFLYRIPELSDNFIIGCDDFFFINKIPENLFFDNDTAIQYCEEIPFKYWPGNSSWAQMTNNSLKFLSQFNDKIMNPYKHFFEARNKKWECDWFIPKYGQIVIDSLKISKFRHDTNILPTVFADTMRLTNTTIHKNIYNGFSYIRMCADIDLNNYSACKMVCINDTAAVDGFEICKAKSIKFLDNKLSNKSSFELFDNKKDVTNSIAIVNNFERKKSEARKSRATYLYF